MSRAVYRGGKAQPFTERLPAIDPNAPRPTKVSSALQRTYGGELDRLREQAHVEGYRDGRAKGMEEGIAAGREQAAREATLARAQEAQEYALFLERQQAQVEQALTDMIESMSARIPELAVAIAARILHERLDVSRESVLAIAASALQEVMHGVSVRLRLNATDAALVESRFEHLLRQAPGVTGVEIVVDPTMAGGCMVETDGGVVDARIEHMLERALQGLKEAA